MSLKETNKETVGVNKPTANTAIDKFLFLLLLKLANHMVLFYINQSIANTYLHAKFKTQS